MLGNLYIVSQIQSQDATKWRAFRNQEAHCHPAFVDALDLLEKWASVDEQEKLLKNIFLVSKSCYLRNISILSMWRGNVLGSSSLTYIS